MISEGAFVSVRAISNKWLIKKQKSIHSLWIALTHAADAVQFLQLTSLPLPQHIILTRPAGQQWFDLPPGFMHLVSVGIPSGNSWVPVAVSDKLLPMPNYDGNTGLGAGFGAGFNQGTQINWGDAPYIPGPSYSSSNYSATYFSTAAVPAGTTVAAWDHAVQCYDWNQSKTLIVNPYFGQIYTGRDFCSDKLYMVYVAKNTLKTMTHIPVEAEMAILAYMDWQYEYNKRSPNMQKAEKAYRQWVHHQKIIRAVNNPLQSAADYAALLNWRYRSSGASSSSVATANPVSHTQSSSGSGTAATNSQFSITVPADGTTVTDARIAGRTPILVLISGGGMMFPTDYTVTVNTLTLTNGSSLTAGTQLVLLFA